MGERKREVKGKSESKQKVARERERERERETYTGGSPGSALLKDWKQMSFVLYFYKSKLHIQMNTKLAYTDLSLLHILHLFHLMETRKYQSNEVWIHHLIIGLRADICCQVNTCRNKLWYVPMAYASAHLRERATQ